MATVEEKAARVVMKAAQQSARTHRGESALQFHLAQWGEESGKYTLIENYIMLKAAEMLLKEGLV